MMDAHSRGGKNNPLRKWLGGLHYARTCGPDHERRFRESFMKPERADIHSEWRYVWAPMVANRGLSSTQR